jgi:chaperonin GroES
MVGNVKDIKPLADRVLVEPLEQEETTPSGLVLPDTAKEKPQEGKILAVGPGRLMDSGERAPLEVKVGDKVLFAKYAGTEIKKGDQKYLLLTEKDILAVV